MLFQARRTMTKYHLLVKQFHNLHYQSQLLFVGDLEDDSTSQNSNAVALSMVIIITEKLAYSHPRMVGLFKLDCEYSIHHIIMKYIYIYSNNINRKHNECLDNIISEYARSY